MTIMPLLLLILALGPGRVGADVTAQWKLFVSRSLHFSVEYPSLWNRLQDHDVAPDADTLEIINFPNKERVEGVIIKKGGASISVNLAPSGINSARDWIRRYNRDNVLLDDRTIPRLRSAPDGCQDLRRIVSRDEVAPNAFSIETDYFCSTPRGLYVVLLTNWEGDPHQPAYQDIAAKVALSLRTRYGSR
jgi:hypothetical protein